MIEVPSALAPLQKEKNVTLEEGWGSASASFKVKKKIFAMVIDDELVLKLPKPRVDELVGAKQGRRFDPRKNGRVMKEWIVLMLPLKKWLPLAREALSFVGK
jgi:hypothetical protein